MDTAAAWVFWASVGLMAYTYVGYPAAIWLVAVVRPRQPLRGALRRPVTVVVVAHDEASRIEAKIENLLAQTYPADQLEVVVASDGSTDDTVRRARRYEPRIRVVAFDERRGKPAVLNDVIRSARGDIVVLADARQQLDPDCVRQLVDGFADPQVGAVSGELVLVADPGQSAAGEGTAVYWGYEKLVRWAESRVDSTVGATGALYAIRRDLFEPIPPDTILDDVLIPLQIARHGRRVLFEPAARAFDQRVKADRAEFVRKVRTIGGNFQLFFRERWTVNPFRNRLWIQTISHKVLRLFLPVFWVGAFAGSLALAGRSWLYAVSLGAQIAFLAGAAFAYGVPPARRRVPGLVVPYAMCFLTWATVVGFVYFLTGRQRVTWRQPLVAERTDAGGRTPAAR